ncbi:hypothetical protein [Gimesia sp.]|uniref:hypothetical protein n=1 Tax=Gimesia sp. TaxID=2024833 RepID=UPI003A90935A
MKLFFSLILPQEDEQILKALDFPFALFSDSKFTCNTEIWRSQIQKTRSCDVDRIKQMVQEFQANFVYHKMKSRSNSKHWLNSVTGCLSVSPINPLWVQPKHTETKRRQDHSIAIMMHGRKAELNCQSIDFYPSILELIMDIAEQGESSTGDQQVLDQITKALNHLSNIPGCLGFAYRIDDLYADLYDNGISYFLNHTVVNRIRRWPAALPLLKTRFPGFYPFLFGPTSLLKEVKGLLEQGVSTSEQFHFVEDEYYSGVSFLPEIMSDPRLRFHHEQFMNVPFADESATDLEVLNLLKPYLIELKHLEKEKEHNLQEYPGVFLHKNGSVTAYLTTTYQELLDSDAITPLLEDWGLLECPLPCFQKLLGLNPEQVLVLPEALRGIDFIEQRLMTEYERLSQTSSDTVQNIISAYENKSIGQYRDQFKVALELGLFAGNK